MAIRGMGHPGWIPPLPREKPRPTPEMMDVASKIVDLLYARKFIRQGGEQVIQDTAQTFADFAAHLAGGPELFELKMVIRMLADAGAPFELQSRYANFYGYTCLIAQDGVTEFYKPKNWEKFKIPKRVEVYEFAEIGDPDRRDKFLAKFS